MDASGTTKARRSAGKPCGDCACGCGVQLLTDAKGRRRKWVLGHQNLGTKIDWDQRFADYVKRAPLCLCGCGGHVKPIANSASELQHIYQGGENFPKFILGHHRRPQNAPAALSKHVRQCLLGSLLGDGSIGLPHGKSTNYRMLWTHGLPQKAWVEHKADVLRELSPVVVRARNMGFGTTSVRMRTPCLPCITEIAKVAVRSGRKTVTLEWLNQIGDAGLAWWYCDDGHLGQRAAFFHTEGYPLEEVHIIRDWMEGKLGGASIYRSNRGHHYIRLPFHATRQLFERIASFVPDCMRYKLHNGNEYRSAA